MSKTIRFVYAGIWRPVAIVLTATVVLAVSACSEPASLRAGQAVADPEVLHSLPNRPLTYNDIRPTLERRCIVCHGCYDAPCQLKLSSMQGVARGANKLKVYNKKRFAWQQPSRLFIDANTTAAWRDMDFYSVLAETGSTAPEDQLQKSVLYKMLRLKQQNPMLKSGMLPEDFDISLERKQVCPTLDEFDRFARDHPLWGMPYALPKWGIHTNAANCQ